MSSTGTDSPLPDGGYFRLMDNSPIFDKKLFLQPLHEQPQPLTLTHPLFPLELTRTRTEEVHLSTQVLMYSNKVGVGVGVEGIGGSFLVLA